MTEAIVKAKLAELAAKAEVTKLKAEKNQHWEGELHREIILIRVLAQELERMVERK